MAWIRRSRSSTPFWKTQRSCQATIRFTGSKPGSKRTSARPERANRASPSMLPEVVADPGPVVGEPRGIPPRKIEVERVRHRVHRRETRHPLQRTLLARQLQHGIERVVRPLPYKLDDGSLRQREVAVDDHETGRDLPNQPEQPEVLDDVIEEPQDGHDVEAVSVFKYLFERRNRRAFDKLHPVARIVAGKEPEPRQRLRARLDAHDGRSARRREGMGPSSVVGTEIENPRPRDRVEIRADDQTMPLVQPADGRRLPAVLGMSVEEIERLRHFSALCDREFLL